MEDHKLKYFRTDNPKNFSFEKKMFQTDCRDQIFRNHSFIQTVSVSNLQKISGAVKWFEKGKDDRRDRESNVK